MSTRTAPWLVLGLLLLSAGCMLGPQPEPPDLTENTDENEGDAGSLTDGDGDVDTDIEDGYAGEDPAACDPDLAGSEWDCGCGDREGHEPPGPFIEVDVEDLRVRAPTWPEPTDDETNETAYDSDGDPTAAD